MAIDWNDEERAVVEQGINDHGIRSGRCTALARIVFRVALPRDPETRGVHLKPKAPVRRLVSKKDGIPLWFSHTLVETQAHRVDAITGADGYPSEQYLDQCWHDHHTFEVLEIDVSTIDPGIQDGP